MSELNSSDLKGKVSSGTSTKKCNKSYRYFNSYDNAETAHNLITDKDGFEGHNWKYLKTVESAKGSTVWYRCYENNKCPLVALKNNCYTETCQINIGEGEHIHTDGKTRNKSGIRPEVKEMIKEFENLEISPACMMRTLRDKTMFVPTIQQLNNYLRTIRAKKGRPSKADIEAKRLLMLKNTTKTPVRASERCKQN